MTRNDFDLLTTLLIAAARSVEKAGANFILICANTMHVLADAVQAGINIPLIHIADATLDEIKQRNFTKVGLLGTQFTMEQDFIRSVLSGREFRCWYPNCPTGSLFSKSSLTNYFPISLIPNPRQGLFVS